MLPQGQLLQKAGLNVTNPYGLVSLGSSKVATALSASTLTMGSYTPPEEEQDAPYGLFEDDDTSSASVQYPPSAAGTNYSSAASSSGGGSSTPSLASGVSDMISAYANRAPALPRPAAAGVGQRLNALA